MAENMKYGIFIQWTVIFSLKKILSHATTWTNLENIMLSEICQTQKAHTARLHFYEVSKVVKLLETENGMMGTRSWGREKRVCYSIGIELVLRNEEIGCTKCI